MDHAVQDRETSLTDGFDCTLCHVPYHDVDLPLAMSLTRCMLCRMRFNGKNSLLSKKEWQRQGKVPDVIFATIEPPEDLPTTGTGCFLQARVCRAKKREKGEAHAENVSQILPFLEYELHQQLMNKLKVKGMNAAFGLKAQVTVAEQVIIGVMSATAVYVTALPAPPIFLVASGKNGRSEDDKRLMEIQKKIIDATAKARGRSLHPGDQTEFPLTATPPNTPIYHTYSLLASRDSAEVRDEPADARGQLDLAAGVKETYILEVDDKKDEDFVEMMLDSAILEGVHIFNTESTPGIHSLHSDTQFLTVFQRRKLYEDDLKSAQTLSRISNDMIKSLCFKVRNMKPCSLTKLTFDVEIPEDDNLQVSITASVIRVQQEKRRRRVTSTSGKSDSCKGSLEGDDMLFQMDETEIDHDGNTTHEQTSKGHTQTEKKLLETGYKLSRSWPLTNWGSLRTRSTSSTRSDGSTGFQPPVTITPMSKIPNTHVERYLGNINLFFIRESTSIKEDGGLNMFMQCFIAEVHAVLKGHVLALGGNAVLAFSLNEIILLDSPHKNQGQCLLNVSGDAAFVMKQIDEYADLNHTGKER